MLYRMLAPLLCSTSAVMSWPYSGGLANCCTPCERQAAYAPPCWGTKVTEDCCRGKAPLQEHAGRGSQDGTIAGPGRACSPMNRALASPSHASSMHRDNNNTQAGGALQQSPESAAHFLNTQRGLHLKESWRRHD